MNIYLVTAKVTFEIESTEAVGVNFAGATSNFWEHSVYADPSPIPAPKATDAQRVTGLPATILNVTRLPQFVENLAFKRSQAIEKSQVFNHKQYRKHHLCNLYRSE